MLDDLNEEQREQRYQMRIAQEARERFRRNVRSAACVFIVAVITYDVDGAYRSWKILRNPVQMTGYVRSEQFITALRGSNSCDVQYSYVVNGTLETGFSWHGPCVAGAVGSPIPVVVNAGHAGESELGIPILVWGRLAAVALGFTTMISSVLCLLMENVIDTFFS